MKIFPERKEKKIPKKKIFPEKTERFIENMIVQTRINMMSFLSPD